MSALMALHPADVRAAPEPDRVAALLAGLGLLAAPTAGGAWTPPGPRFMELVSFLGCSPALITEGDAAYAARVAPVVERPRLRLGANTAAPRCARCRCGVEDWAAKVPGWRADPLGARWTCPRCRAESAACELDWRRGAGAARAFVDLRGVYPAEAVPSDTLFDALRGLGAGPWQYFYLREEIA